MDASSGSSSSSDSSSDGALASTPEQGSVVSSAFPNFLCFNYPEIGRYLENSDELEKSLR